MILLIKMIKIQFKNKLNNLLSTFLQLLYLLFNNIFKIHILLNKIKFSHHLKEVIQKMIFIVKIKVLSNKANHQYMEILEVKKLNFGENIIINMKKIHALSVDFIIILFKIYFILLFITNPFLN